MINWHDFSLYVCSSCSEDSPKKEMLLTAATQAFAADTDEEKVNFFFHFTHNSGLYFIS